MSKDMVVASGTERKEMYEFLRDSLPEEHFITQYMNMSEEITDAYPEYAFMYALNLLSSVMKRDVMINITPTKLRLNLWINLLGVSTTSVSFLQPLRKFPLWWADY